MTVCAYTIHAVKFLLAPIPILSPLSLSVSFPTLLPLLSHLYILINLTLKGTGVGSYSYSNKFVTFWRTNTLDTNNNNDINNAVHKHTHGRAFQDNTKR